MNKNVSLAIEKAVSNLDKIENNDLKDLNSKKPDLFSLNNQTELFQNDKGIIIKIDRSKDNNLTDFGRATLTDRYLDKTSPTKIYLQELLAHMQTIIYMLKDFITI